MKKIVILLLALFSTVSFSQSSKETPSIVNVYNFVRRTALPHGNFTYSDFNAIKRQLEVNKQYGIAGTYALKYDALMDPSFQKFFKENLNEHDDLGAWWEVNRELAEKAGVTFLAEKNASLKVNKVYSLAYTPEERKKLLDVYMADFKAVYGKYPTSIGSWVMDIVSFKYAHEKYGVTAGVLCRDQMGVDGFTLNGGYYDQAYYPSLKNEFIPAQNKENQLNMPIFRLLSPDPIYNFESDNLRDDIGGVYTMEPSWIRGKTPSWVDWYFKTKNEEKLNSYSYTHVGQENTFLWKRIEAGYEMQISKVVEMAKNSELRVETLKETADWFKKKYKTTPVSSITVNSDWNKFGYKAFWYSSKFYRTSGLLDGDEFFIRDIWLYNENYTSRYLNNTLSRHESTFDALPLLDAHFWGTKRDRAKISFYDAKSNKRLKGSSVKFEAIDENKYQTIWTLNSGGKFIITAIEDQLYFALEGGKNEFYVEFAKLPTFKAIEKQTVHMNHNKFDYFIKIKEGTVSKKTSLRIASSNGKVTLDLSMNNNSGKSNFTAAYLKKPNEIDKDLEFKFYQNKGQQMCKVPEFSHDLGYKSIGKTSQVSIVAKDENSQIHYTLDGSDPDENSPLYQKPITINESTTIKAIATKEGLKNSRVSEGNYFRSYKIKNIKNLNNTQPHKNYSNGGIRGLINGTKGSWDFGDGNWLGFNDDVEVLVDMEAPINFNSFNITFLQVSRDWVFLPPYVELYGSNDGKTFEKLKRVEYNLTRPIKEMDKQNFNYRNKSNKKFRYFKLFVKSQGDCPPWSICAGNGPGFLFMDEICID